MTGSIENHALRRVKWNTERVKFRDLKLNRNSGFSGPKVLIRIIPIELIGQYEFEYLLKALNYLQY